MKSDLTKILIVFHCAGESRARKMFEAFSELENVELKVVGPQRPWHSKEKIEEDLKEANYELVLAKTFDKPKALSDKFPFNCIQDWPYKTDLFRIVKKFKPDIIQVFSEAFSLPVAQVIVYKNLVSSKSKVFFYAFENMEVNYQPLRSNKFFLSYWNYIRKRVFGGSTANMEAIDILIRMGIPNERLRRIFWGIPMDIFFPRKVDTLKARLNLKDGFIVGYVGRIVSEKGIDLLLNALHSLPEEYKLLLLGQGPSLNDVQAQWESLNLESRVISTATKGWVEAADYLNCMDVLVVPSRQSQTWKEQYGRVIPEAMACGVPVIGSSSGAIPEVIGDAGLVFAEDNYEELCAQIKRVKEDDKLRAFLIEKGLSRAKIEFSGQAFAKKQLEFYLS